MRLLLNRFSVHRFFNKKNWTNPASTFLTSHDTNLTINDKSVDGVLGSRTLGGRMEGADESTEVWRHRKGTSFFLHKKLLYFFTPYFLGEVGINIALACLLPVAVVRHACRRPVANLVKPLRS